MSTAGERESYEALRSSYIHLLSFFDTSAVHPGKKKALSGNVIKLSKSAHTKKSPPRLFEVGIFYAFVMWIACAYFAGRTMTCPS